MDTAWTLWRDHFAGELATLGEGDFINSGAPGTTRERGPGLFGRPRKPDVIPGPLLNVLGMGTHLLMESVTAYPTRWDFPLSDEQRDQLTELGWLLPSDSGSAGGPGLSVYVPVSEFERAADLAMNAYLVLGVADPDEVEVERGS